MEANEGIAFVILDYINKTELRNRTLTFRPGPSLRVLAQFGWALLLLCSALYLLVQFLKKRRREGGSEEPVPETEGRAEALEAARRRMQEELDCRAALYKEKMRQFEFFLQNIVKIVRTGQSDMSDQEGELVTDLCLFSDYSPLSGQAGGSCSWRPGRRGPSSGG
uniref:Uncharacterized protein n=1 Tax=Oryzias melastigma TaxID=30732 RepID=A0A3B3BQR8_ORYME